jgi:membrane protease YdiL (CAAX protease family)
VFLCARYISDDFKILFWLPGHCGVYRNPMPEELVIQASVLPVEMLPERTCPSNRMRWFEFVLLLSIAFGPSVLTSLHQLVTGPASTPSAQDFRWALSLLHEMTSLLLLGYILSRRKVRFANLGLRWSRKDLPSGVALAIGSYCAYYVGRILVHSIYYAMFGAAHDGKTVQSIFGHVGFFAIPISLLNPLFEEMIVRAYLMTEIRELTGSALLSVVSSFVLQTTYHLYYGWEGALSLGFLFLVFAIYYSRTRRATPIILAHGAFDLLSLVRLW